MRKREPVDKDAETEVLSETAKRVVDGASDGRSLYAEYARQIADYERELARESNPGRKKRTSR
jgi:hypothetical protein